MAQTPKTLSLLLILAGAVYGAAFWVMVTLDEKSAWSRFEALTMSGAHGRAAAHGDQALALRGKNASTDQLFYDRALQVADAHRHGGHRRQAITLYGRVLKSPFAGGLSPASQMAIKQHMALLHLAEGHPVEAGLLMADLVDAAGDAAARPLTPDAGKEATTFLSYVNQAVGGFTDALPPIIPEEIIKGDDATRLFAAERLASLGGYYARLPDGDYAAAGLLAAVYRTRLKTLGAGHEDTVHTALLLAPVYERIGRLKDAEEIYLQTFHAQERAKGANNPELSLYIRLLSDIYQRQGRITEAEALNVHMRTIFRDAFGARRYAPNQDRDRREDINRPVFADFPLPADYIPADLVPAAAHGIKVSKHRDLEEMMIRAVDLEDETGDGTADMPSLLAELMDICAPDKEKLSLRSGYRSYGTQKALYARPGHGGKVARPGTSEHQLGLAVDIDVNGRFMRSTDRAFQCFEEQAWRYGFILSYPRGNRYLEADDGFEPWHWRFVGPRTALLYREIGPIGYPQEFLAALPCYEERALSGLFVSAGQDDICLRNMLSPRPSAASPDYSTEADG